LLLIPVLITAQDSNRVDTANYWPSGSIAVILGLSNAFGAHYGASVHFTDRWSVEIARGAITDFNLGGRTYDMTLTGVALNRYFPLKHRTAILASIFYSHSKVIQTSYEYRGDFTLWGPMIGIDISAPSGFGTFVRGALMFGSANYKKGSTILGADVGLFWRFHVLGAP
jgi:hypothetical protein